MKIFWNVNVKLPVIYQIQGKDNLTNVGGWLTQICDMLLADTNNELLVVYPTNVKSGENGGINNFQYRGLYFNPKQLRLGNLAEEENVKKYKELLKKNNPDIIHIHGTEFQYSYFLIEAARQCGMIQKVVISIQGMVKYYAKHYALGIPLLLRYVFTIKEFILKSNISSGISSYIRRGIYEEKALMLAKHVIGRTNWDKGCVYLINPKTRYHFCNETLRKTFYSNEWRLDNCNPHSIFISQASYPVKGFHLFLQALAEVKKYYPDVMAYIAGPSMLTGNILRGSSYALYIQKLIKKLDVAANVTFLGPQTADQMKREMLKANVFVSPSTIENSPNSLGEAMLLGVPCISSDVGGVSDLMIHCREGYVYPLEETYMLAYYIIKIFNEPKLAQEMGKNARNHASATHNPNNNFNRLLEIYNEIMT